jgi:hypothetical protein
MANVGALMGRLYGEVLEQARTEPDTVEARSTAKMVRSVHWLGGHFADVPLTMFTFDRQDPSGGGSAFPAVWSSQLAPRAIGIGSTTTPLFRHPVIVPEVIHQLQVPNTWTLITAATIGYRLGCWGIASSGPPNTLAYGSEWCKHPGSSNDGPLWPPRPEAGQSL